MTTSRRWQLAALGVVCAIYIWNEHFRERRTPVHTAIHTSPGVPIGGFALGCRRDDSFVHHDAGGGIALAVVLLTFRPLPRFPRLSLRRFWHACHGPSNERREPSDGRTCRMGCAPDTSRMHPE
jgi:hypothetical protein